MREIKFRQWLGDRYEYWGIGIDGNTFVGPCSGGMTRVDKTPHEQFTGLTDRNGVEIYEGDITRVYSHGYESTHLIEWGGEYPAFELSGWDGDCNGLHYCMCEADTEIEVIGNIHQNTELLEIGHD